MKLSLSEVSKKKSYVKLILVEKSTGNKTSAIFFDNVRRNGNKKGRVYVGDDVWRLSNALDSCEYPVKAYKDLNMVLKEYDILQAPTTIFYERGEVV